ncbi:hypothetical protein [Variovorax sp. J31P207]|uniref:hypothetical protein n=1 Tax=Variovorax sp. J31P207 TaxID=3053510 RepID=UPI002575DF03|nr:hypothetical protein [Variovorax sp. J31P207]MDM0071850.1 hypothetical protein [Variovorax sp. J31P207]
MRQHFLVDWAFGIRGAIEGLVRQNFPQDLRQWPLLQAFDFEGFQLDENYAVIVLKDKLSGVPAGGDELRRFNHQGAPALPPRVEDIQLWQFFFRTKLELRNEDGAFLIPIHDSGKSGAPADFDLFSVAEQFFWNQQLQFVVANYKAHLHAMNNQAPTPPSQVTYNVSGSNARVNINSADFSQNIVQAQSSAEVFALIGEAVSKIADRDAREALASSAKQMQEAHGTKTFLEKYQRFMSSASDHATVLAPIFAPLAGLLT